MQAALDLLEGHVCEAATFRYTASILLRLLPVRSACFGCVGVWGQGSKAICKAKMPGHAQLL